MTIIPAIDLIEGQCVRLSQGDYEQKKQYAVSPVDMIKDYVAHGLHRIHVVDLDGAKASSPQNLSTLRLLSSIADAEIEWGGGIKSDEALQSVFDAGATYAVVGSIAAQKPLLFQRWLETYGGERMVLGADVRDGKVSINGWTEDTTMTIDDLIDCFLPHGLTQVICTDISCDGMLQGPADALYIRLHQKYPSLKITVSGGISSLEDIRRLERAGLDRIIVGKAIYEGRIKLDELC